MGGILIASMAGFAAPELADLCAYGRRVMRIECILVRLLICRDEQSLAACVDSPRMGPTALAQRPVAHSPFQPQPVLPEAQYEQALEVLRNARNALERTPSLTARLYGGKITGTEWPGGPAASHNAHVAEGELLAQLPRHRQVFPAPLSHADPG
jgi:hypothetical protein